MVDLYDAHSRRPSLIPGANTYKGMKRYNRTKTHPALQGDRHAMSCKSQRRNAKPHQRALTLILHPKALSAKENTRSKGPRASETF